MYQLWLNKVYKAVQRSLSNSELTKLRSLYDNGYSVSGAVEYING